jgi:regulator of replication initiation timing
MDVLNKILMHPFTWGLGVGLFLLGLSFWSHLKTRREYSRYRRHLSDKMELEAEQLRSLKTEHDALKKENESLRIQNASLREKPDQKLGRELEIMARAERALMVNAPGFAPAWETAKERASEDLMAEAAGKSLPKKIFRKFFRGSSGSAEGTMIEALPLPAGDDKERLSDSQNSQSKSSV